MSLTTVDAPMAPTMLTDAGVLTVGHVIVRRDARSPIGDADEIVLTALDDPDNWDRTDRPTVRPGTHFEYLRVELHRDSLPARATSTLASMMGYLWRSALRASPDAPLSEHGDARDWIHYDDRSVTFRASSYDVNSRQSYFALARFIEQMSDTLQDGTPPRKRDGGSRLVEGFGFPVPFSVWLDTVDVTDG